jgi:hypothetical protein
MRFHYGAVPEDTTFQPETEGYRGIREPSPIAIQLWAFPVSLLQIAAWGLVVGLIVLPKLGPGALRQTGGSLPPFWQITLLILALIPVHELLHALAHPGFGATSNTVIGFWLSRGLFYAHYEGDLSRSRFLLISAMPLLVLGLLPTLLMVLYPPLLPSLWLLSLLGSIFACGDLVGMAVILLEIPPGAILRNRGWKTYWKPAG